MSLPRKMVRQHLPNATMPYKVYISFILYPSQEWDQSITSIRPISDWFRPFCIQIYSSTDGSRQIMEPRLKSINPPNQPPPCPTYFTYYSYYILLKNWAKV